MKPWSLVLFSMLAAGCATAPKRIDMGVRFLTRPVQITFEVRQAQEHFDSVPSRYKAELLVLSPEEKKGKTLHVVLDDVTSEWAGVVTPGSRWRIACDEFYFEEQARFGFTIFHIAEMKPQRIPAPNQPPQPTR